MQLGLHPYRMEGVKKLSEKGDAYYKELWDALWEGPCTENSPECISYKKGDWGMRVMVEFTELPQTHFTSQWWGGGQQTGPGPLLEWLSRVSLPVFLCTAPDIGFCKHSLKVST